MEYNIINEEQILDFTDFLASIYNPGRPRNFLLYGYVFRGESTTKYTLLPSMLREYNRKIWCESKLNHLPLKSRLKGTNFELINLEFFMLRQFYELSNKRGLPIPECKLLQENFYIKQNEKNNLRYWYPTEDSLMEYSSFYMIAALAQHYGLPTRLLDWSYDLETSLYFAASNALKSQDNKSSDDQMVIWAINKRWFEFIESIDNKDESIDNKGKYIPIKFITPLYHLNNNLCAQRGTLSLCIERINPTAKVKPCPINEILANWINENQDFVSHIFQGKIPPLLFKYLISVHECENIMKYLYFKNINASTIFQGASFSSVAEAVRELAFYIGDVL